MNTPVKPSKRYAEYVRKITCSDWEYVGTKGGDKAVLRHVPTGETVAYCLHDGGNDYNGPRNFAAQVQRICGCRMIEARGRKKSRKAVKQERIASKYEDQLILLENAQAARREEAEKARAEKIEAVRRQALVNELERRRRQAALEDRTRREIEQLMRPGYGR